MSRERKQRRMTIMGVLLVLGTFSRAQEPALDEWIPTTADETGPPKFSFSSLYAVLDILSGLLLVFWGYRHMNWTTFFASLSTFRMLWTFALANYFRAHDAIAYVDAGTK